MARLSKEERLAIRERLRKKLEGYTYEDIVALVYDLVPKKLNTEASEAKKRALHYSPIRAIIAMFLIPLLKRSGGQACLTPMGGLKPGPVRDEYLAWYMAHRGPELMKTKPSRTPASIKTLALIQAREAIHSYQSTPE